MNDSDDKKAKELAEIRRQEAETQREEKEKLDRNLFRKELDNSSEAVDDHEADKAREQEELQRTEELREANLGDEVDRDRLSAVDNEPGNFDRQHDDSLGRLTSIEGWVDLKKSGESRGSLDAAERKKVSEAWPEHRREHQDASHIVANALGGSGLDNLVAMDQKMNRSFYSVLEDRIRDEAKEAAKEGGDVYVRFEVEWGKDELTPEDVRIQVFRGELADEKLEKVFEFGQKTDWKAESDTRTHAQLVKDHGYDSSKDFLTSEKKEWEIEQ